MIKYTKGGERNSDDDRQKVIQLCGRLYFRFNIGYILSRREATCVHVSFDWYDTVAMVLCDIRCKFSFTRKQRFPGRNSWLASGNSKSM